MKMVSGGLGNNMTCKASVFQNLEHSERVFRKPPLLRITSSGIMVQHQCVPKHAITVIRKQALNFFCESEVSMKS